MRRPRRGLLALVGLVLVAGPLLVEALLQVDETLFCRKRMPDIMQRDPFFGWRHRPGARDLGRGCYQGETEWSASTELNQLGLRGPETAHERGDASFRVLVLGDSFVEAVQVDREQTLVARLEERLDRRAKERDPAARVEVLNAGTSGWSTDNELTYFRREGIRFQPDLVLLVFNIGNDVLENEHGLIESTGYYPAKPYFSLVDGEPVPVQPDVPDESRLRRAVVATYQTFAPYSALIRRLGATEPGWKYLQNPPDPPVGSRPARPHEVYLAEDSASWSDGWRITLALIRKLRDEVEASGARFAVVVLNGREEISPRHLHWVFSRHPDLAKAEVDVDKPNRRITEFLAEEGIVAIPLLDEFRARFGADGTPGFFAWDTHWAPPGHALAAEVIERELAARGIVP